MYKIKEEKIAEIKEKTNRKISEISGVSENYISQIINERKTNISKTVAYAITKALNCNYEITDVFDVKEE